MSIEARIAELGLTLPEPAKPVASYVSYVRSGNQVTISGQLSNDANGGIKGTVGVDVTPEQALEAARLCGLNLIAQIKAACDGDLDRVVRIVKLGGFVQAGPDFIAIPAVINGCSDLMVEVFGDAGKHARSAVGVYKLPLGFAVEIDAIVEIR
ncbi:enamine deaminase RidA (YjgF/YER057c/UK114 family) [Brevundimonas vesicularis]|uniref:Enamine deaminase RidA (YjgF/YER057c/UK114 family) n=1 Tax=Brevundimonas vesicularis TaxID=41276 RepID=A0A7W9FT73_BREVE|nr:RidA family protein [Brevundimonas vesicularis]MBB5771110.1 enamine deaminase RidA (YjgF/YER057c/UK114 family) [Brevundimonas vesicularis]